MSRYKDILRKNFRLVRKNLDLNYQTSSSNKVYKLISQLDSYRYAKKIALYHAVQGEINLKKLWKNAPLHSKECYFPGLKNDGSLEFLQALPTSEFVANKYNIPEPKDTPLIATNELDIIFMPLVAVDIAGNRLGSGFGYYDKTLEDIKNPLLIGTAYEFQIENFINKNAWDIPLDIIVTPQRIIRCKL